MMEFIKWKEKQQQEVMEIMATLEIPLSDDPEALWQELKEVEAYYGRLQYIVAEADKFLDIAECQELEKLQRQYEKLAAYEKEKMVNAAVSDVRAFRDLAQGLVDAIKQRIMLGQSRMAYMRDVYLTEIKIGGGKNGGQNNEGK